VSLYPAPQKPCLVLTISNQCRYLQLPISKIHVAKGAAQLHQGCAIFRCLESGLTVFHPKYPLNKRQLRVVRGIFAFLLYSSEYWVDCLLDLAKLPNDLAPSLEFWTIASRVSEQLSRLGRFDSDQGGLTSDISDLEPIRNLRGLHYNAQLVLQARLERKIPAETPQSRGSLSYPPAYFFPLLFPMLVILNMM